RAELADQSQVAGCLRKLLDNRRRPRDQPHDERGGEPAPQRAAVRSAGPAPGQHEPAHTDREQSERGRDVGEVALGDDARQQYGIGPRLYVGWLTRWYEAEYWPSSGVCELKTS